MTAAAGASWMALIAATTLGTEPTDCVRADISSDANLFEGNDEVAYRLVVQSYDPRSLSSGVVGAHARPIGSVQRAVTAEELRRGVSVDVLSPREGLAASIDQVVVAWIERGEPDLEFDGLRARPSAGAFLGVADAPLQAATVVLRRPA